MHEQRPKLFKYTTFAYPNIPHGHPSILTSLIYKYGPEHSTSTDVRTEALNNHNHVLIMIYCRPELAPSSGPPKPSSSPGSRYPPEGFAPLVRPSTILDESIASLSSRASCRQPLPMLICPYPFPMQEGTRAQRGVRREEETYLAAHHYP
jgi:hypothetical protein